MLWLLEDALWPVVSGYLQQWVMSCFIWGLRAVSDAEVVVIKRNVTGKCVKSRFICELARCRRRSVAMERHAGVWSGRLLLCRAGLWLAGSSDSRPAGAQAAPPGEPAGVPRLPPPPILEVFFSPLSTSSVIQ